MELIICKEHSDDSYMVIESHALETYRSGPNHDVLALSAGGETYVWQKAIVVMSLSILNR